MPDINYGDLNRYAKALANFTPEHERLVIETGHLIKPHLSAVTETFYAKLMAVPEARQFLGDRVDHLKKTHMLWLEKVFSGPYDDGYTAYMYRIGWVHVQVNLPIEFMPAGATLISSALREHLDTLYTGNCYACKNAMSAIDAALGYSMALMQKSYQSSMEEQLAMFRAAVDGVESGYGRQRGGR